MLQTYNLICKNILFPKQYFFGDEASNILANEGLSNNSFFG